MILAAYTPATGCVWECGQCRGTWRLATPERLLAQHEATCYPPEAKEPTRTSCGWNPMTASPDCDHDPTCPVHGQNSQK